MLRVLELSSSERGRGRGRRRCPPACGCCSALRRAEAPLAAVCFVFVLRSPPLPRPHFPSHRQHTLSISTSFQTSSHVGVTHITGAHGSAQPRSTPDSSHPGHQPPSDPLCVLLLFFFFFFIVVVFQLITPFTLSGAHTGLIPGQDSV